MTASRAVARRDERWGFARIADCVGVPGHQNCVVLTLGVSSAIAAAATGFVSIAPNRLVSGRSVALWAAAGDESAATIVALIAATILVSFLSPTRAVNWVVAALGLSLFLLVLFAAGHSTTLLTAGTGPAARVSLGTAFWVLLFCSALAIVDALQRLQSGPLSRLAIAVLICGAVAIMADTGLFEALSVMREYQNKRDVFATEIGRHCTLVMGALVPALVIGVPLGVLALDSPRLRGPLFATLNILQTIPSVALFGILIAPLSVLADAVPALASIGVRGIGMAPAIIALVLYALLPVVRNTYAGFAGVDRAVIEAAKGMGLTRRQILRTVELPLAFPVLLAGLRIVLVQAIGLAVVAALIGAGGLGTFVFQGLGQYASDLVLLGAIPAILLALAADMLLQTVIALVRRRATP
ncbi:MAG: ABC transporter permease [Hyphomicrobiales bacterium]